MQYFYVALWLLVGFILIFSMAKENKIFYFAGGFFILLGLWWLADALLPENLFAGGWGVALRCVTAAALVLLSVVFFLERQKSVKREMQGKPNRKEEKDGSEQE